MSRYFGDHEGPVKPHLAKETSEVGDLRLDADRGFQRVADEIDALSGGGPIAFVYYNGTPDTVLAKHNITSVTKQGTGTYDVQISVTDPAAEQRLPLVSLESGAPMHHNAESFGGGVYRVRVWDAAGSPVDAVMRWSLFDVTGAVAGP